jgi:hypothetical protein
VLYSSITLQVTSVRSGGGFPADHYCLDEEPSPCIGSGSFIEGVFSDAGFVLNADYVKEGR